MPGDMSPGTEWGMMWGFSGDVTLWVLFGGRPGLELKHTGQSIRRTWVRDVEETGRGRRGCVGGGGGGAVLTFRALQNAIPFQRANMYCK